MRSRGLSTVLLVLALAACASSPGYRSSEVPVPPAFRETTRDTLPPPAAPAPAALAPDTVVPVLPPEAAGPVDQANYWRALGDTTLDRLLVDLLQGNLDVHAALARLRGARAARTEARLDFAPTITVAGGFTRQQLSSATFPIAAGEFPDQSIWDAGFDAFWELDLFGRIRKNVQGQGALIGAADEDLRDVQVVLSAELARTYFELRGAQERLAVARRNGENQRRTLQVTQQRLDAGRGTAFDAERARAQLGFTLSSIPSLEAQVASAQYAIGTLIGRPPATVAAELTASAAIPALPANIAVASPDSLIRRRPDVASAERQVAAERAFVGAAKAEYLPKITVGGSAGWTALELGAFGDPGSFRYAVGPVVSWPALNLGRVKARVDQSQALADEAQARYEQTVLRALQEVETSLSRYRTARTRVDRIRDAAAASARAAELARLRFEGGVADFLQVLDAERTQLDAEDQLAQAHTDAATSYAALYQALGGRPPATVD
jgi:outer membrane protein, multidrug efflux system